MIPDLGRLRQEDASFESELHREALPQNAVTETGVWQSHRSALKDVEVWSRTSQRDSASPATTHSSQICGMPFPTQLQLASGSRTELNQPPIGGGTRKGVSLVTPQLPVSVATYTLTNMGPHLGPCAGASWPCCFREKTAPPPGGQSRGWAQTTAVCRSSQLRCGQPTRCEGWGRGAWGHPFPN